MRCRYHLFLDASETTGYLKFPYGPDVEALAEMRDTCALDQAERGGMTLESIAPIFGVTRQRVLQIEEIALAKLSDACGSEGIDVSALQHTLPHSDRPARADHLTENDVMDALGLDTQDNAWLRNHWRG